MTLRGRGYRSRFLRALDRIDTRVDGVFDPWRGRAVPDLAAALVSTVSDHGMVWAAIAGVEARRPGPARCRAIGGLALAGCGSYAVNRAVKLAVGRDRPSGDPPVPAARAAPAPRAELPVRTPTSSSFPSGHTLAATCAALTLGTGAGDTAVLGVMALAVAASRVHLRHHHPSDVLGGLLVGGALACATRPLARSLAGHCGTGATGALGIRSHRQRL